MSAIKEHIFVVLLQRRGSSFSWGISVVGGSDQGGPVFITKITPGSPSDKKLRPGDEVKKIGEYDIRDLTHRNVCDLFQMAGASIKLVIKRDPAARMLSSNLHPASAPTNKRPLSSTFNSLSSDPMSPGTPKTVTFAPMFPTHQSDFNENYKRIGEFRNDGNVAESVSSQPYRTTPLVLPGAKAKHEAPTGSYLRHHPNPMMRSGPSHYEYLPHDAAMKQKVADSIITKIEKDESLAGKQIVRKQFNTPIGLYSDKNIVDTIHQSTGFNTGLSRSPSFGRQNQSLGPRKYDPSKSETFKALQEEQYGDGPMQEVNVPVQPRVFTPMKPPPQKTAHPPVQGHTYNPLSHSSGPSNIHHHSGSHINSMGHSDEHIAQSGSFKRLMNMVLSDDY